ncbi:hypothetical protein ACFVG9_35955, partial [Saccharothrix carnea]|uniref:hypothetical protein n=1 Tax=Saccharothrix carnea TaxID=1280637 RepID=UPI003640EDA9
MHGFGEPYREAVRRRAGEQHGVVAGCGGGEAVEHGQHQPPTVLVVGGRVGGDREDGAVGWQVLQLQAGEYQDALF